MSKTAFIFPGQGAQYVGMGKEIALKYSEAMQVYDSIAGLIDIDVKELCFIGPEDEINKTEYTQPCVLATSIAIMKAVETLNIKPDVAAGLSLGEYSALVASGALELKDAIRIVRKRGMYMQRAVPLGKGGMSAVIGLQREEVESCCELSRQNGVVQAVNYNCPGQIVIAGEMPALEKAEQLCKKAGARRVIRLKVTAPFHTVLLKGAGEKLKYAFENVEIDKLNIPVVSNVTADFVSADQIVDMLIRQVSSPVFWEDSINKMIDSGVDTFIEIGPGRILTSFVKKTNKNVKVFNVEDKNTFLKIKSEFRS
ncbi:MAG: ACP S-malonyltransferase [Clostridia bacterium]|nr:ACP S-malonyltransferase [Clostridia bacterium]